MRHWLCDHVGGGREESSEKGLSPWRSPQMGLCCPQMSSIPLPSAREVLRSMEKGCPRDERSEWKTGFHPQVPRGQCSL